MWEYFVFGANYSFIFQSFDREVDPNQPCSSLPPLFSQLQKIGCEVKRSISSPVTEVI